MKTHYLTTYDEIGDLKTRFFNSEAETIDFLKSYLQTEFLFNDLGGIEVPDTNDVPTIRTWVSDNELLITFIVGKIDA